MKAIQIIEAGGPDALQLVDLPEPEGAAGHMLSPGEGVVIDVAAAAVSFPDVLQSRGRYQARPPLPFVPGFEVAGVVRSASAGSGFAAGQRVAALTMGGGMAEVAVAVAPTYLTFALPDVLEFAAGAALVLNYHTAYFALKIRSRLQPGERVLVHGAAGGLGTATLQVARGLGASTIAVVSSGEKERVAREAGADHVVRSDDRWREQVQELTGDGVDVVIDPIGGDRFLDSLRALKENGRLVVVGFTSGSIPEVKVNRLLLRNTEVVGAGWAEYALRRPQINRTIGEALEAMIASGAVRPVVGARFPLARAADAMRLIDDRAATGKVVLNVPG